MTISHYHGKRIPEPSVRPPKGGSLQLAQINVVLCHGFQLPCMVLSVQYWLLALCQWQKQNTFDLSTFRNAVGGEGSGDGGGAGGARRQISTGSGGTAPRSKLGFGGGISHRRS
jgi:hypothetical protein